ncbi:MAG: type I restriction enzyme HsdR N-terminal domain-containing protein [Actinobacteria bacterium]|nr:type I restriction enzyme HsdR N-terminal domain-containing protein [Actinomycetota bacterium]
MIRVAKIPIKTTTRLSEALKRFQPILSSAKARDVNEADTVIIVIDILSELFGYDKYSEITSEHMIRGTYCDLAVMIESKVKLLLEIKAIGLDLKESHTKQAIDYAANKGIDWVILTNSVIWRIYKVSFTKPINQELVAEIDFLTLNHRSKTDIEYLYILTREGLQSQALQDYRIQSQATNRFLIGQLLLTDDTLNILRRELKKIYPDVKIGIDEIKESLVQGVLKRDIIDSEGAVEARKIISKKIIRKKTTVKPAVTEDKSIIISQEDSIT